MELSNDELVARFAILQAQDEEESEGIMLSQQPFAAEKWNLCLVAWVLTDKIMVDAQFGGAMVTIWNLGQWREHITIGEEYVLD
jgi:hypothetical protein